jgi:RimJ/RimL family protein N-acetyltransferase
VSTAAAPPPASTEVTRHLTPDGRVAVVRPARSEDRARFVAAVDGLSRQTHYQRFFSPIPRLPARDIDRLMDFDGTRQIVLHATDEHGVAVVGVARFVFTSPREAELAITVGDAWQHQGLGGALLDRLIAAAGDHGVVRLTAESLADNRAVAALLRSRGFRRTGPTGLTVSWVRLRSDDTFNAGQEAGAGNSTSVKR